jgi:hypothetical protein
MVAEGIDDMGLAGIWRQAGNLNLGVRGGMVGSDHYSIGAEFYRPLNLLGPQSGLLIAWVLGVGATFNDVTSLRVPLGISAGVAWDAGRRPAHALRAPEGGVRAVPRTILGREETDTEFRFDVDPGRGRRLGEAFVLRVGATLGETTTFGAGIAYRLPRRLIVR